MPRRSRLDCNDHEMTASLHSSSDPPRQTRPPYRPPIGIPVQPAIGWRGFLSSVGVHLLIVLLILLPALLPTVLSHAPESAGGPGPAGGGGGGSGGTGGALHERLQYIQVAPAPPAPKAATPTPTPPVVPPVVP